MTRIASATLALTLASMSVRAAAAEVTPDPFAKASFSVANGAGGVPLNVVEAGSPALPSVLFIHGFRQSYLSWTRQFAGELSTQCHLVAFDLRGHGNSGQPWQADAYDHGQPWADDVASVIKSAHLSRPLIVGWSYGGNVAMDFARYYPGIPVAGFVLVSTTAGMIKVPTPPPGAPPRPTTVPNLSTNISAVDASTDFLFPKSVDTGLRDQFRAAAMRVTPFVDRAIIGRSADINTDLVSAIHVPITLVFGGMDKIINPALAQKIAAIFPGANVVSFPAAGHAPFIEEPSKFDALLETQQCHPAGAGR